MTFPVHQTEPAWCRLLDLLDQEPGPLHSIHEAIAFITILLFPFAVQYYVEFFIKQRLRLDKRARGNQCFSGQVFGQYHDRCA
ncbi:hypothetical protein QBC41DRAFT_234740 [Cercophora samala]|uniref:Uncharacterized protein n=1 Tax=Cercophora samala TaxID=330535 RepID=A0AA39Z2I8_9PEZI|nr:hypothetical protein QBC41DRAFT_234740 [Cercophora samala]